MEKVYLVIGKFYGEDDCYTVVSEYSVHSTFEKAKHELYTVLEETVSNAKINNITFKAKMEEKKLTIDWIETDAEEYWEIYERTIDNR